MSNPFADLTDALRQASPTVLAASTRACLHRAGAAFEAAGLADIGADVFSADCLAGFGPQSSVELLLAPVARSQASLRAFAPDPETGEMPGDDESDRAELLAMASEMVLRAEPEMDLEDLLEWADACSSVVLDMNQHLDTWDSDEYGGPDDPLGPLTAAELATQRTILRRLADGTPEDFEQMDRASRAGRAEMLAKIEQVLDEG